jgi:hypothetical protein
MPLDRGDEIARLHQGRGGLKDDERRPRPLSGGGHLERVERHVHGCRSVGRLARGRLDDLGAPRRRDLGDRRVVRGADDAVRAVGERGRRLPGDANRPAHQRDPAHEAQALAGHPTGAAPDWDQEQDRAVHDAASITNLDRRLRASPDRRRW